MPSLHRDAYEPEIDAGDDEPESGSGTLESTDIDSDEVRDGDVDAEGASAVPARNR